MDVAIVRSIRKMLTSCIKSLTYTDPWIHKPFRHFIDTVISVGCVGFMYLLLCIKMYVMIQFCSMYIYIVFCVHV
jgi:hypothetical protein